MIKVDTDKDTSISDSPTKDYRSPEVQDIISERPGFWGIWALPIFLLILLLIVAGTWFIRYPDTIMASAVITATNAPKAIIARQEGKLVNLLVQNGDTISQGGQIGWIESTGSHVEVQQLSAVIDSAIMLLSRNKTGEASALLKQDFKELGDLQPAWQQFVTAWQQFNDYLINGFYYKQKNTLEQDITFLKKNHQGIANQLKLTQQTLALSAKDYEANKTLFDKRVISAKEFRSAKNTFLDKQQSIPQLNQALATNENQQVDKQSEIDRLEHTISQQKKIFEQALQTLKSQVSNWMTRYIITAPTGGTVVFLTRLEKNQFMKNNEILGYVNPPNSRYYARINFSQSNFGKLDTGQIVQLRLTAYPYEEFGYIKGKLRYISNVASDSGFSGNVMLPNGLNTIYNKQIQFRSGLQAQAIIITKQMRLLERFYFNILKKVSQ